MKIEKTEIVNSYQEELTKEIAAGTTYQLRAECRHDCELIRAILEQWLLSWNEAFSLMDKNSFIQSDDVIWVDNPYALDPMVRFIIGDGGPNLNQIRWLIDKLTDCHVAAETVNTRELYTGERIYGELDSLMTVPSTVMIKKAKTKLAESIDSFKYLIKILENARNEISKVLPLSK